MKQRRHPSSQFDAPWSRGVKAATWGVLVLIVGVAIVLPLTLPRAEIWAAVLIPGAVLLVMGAAALFCVRGYTIRSRELWIQRSFWQTRLPLQELERVYADAKALHKCIRSCGNGGFMGITGWFWSRKLGKFRALVTDPARCVVLEFGNRKVVVSPDDPAAFVRALGFEPETSGKTD